MKIIGAIIAFPAVVFLTGCAGDRPDRHPHLTRYCEPGSVIVRYTKGRQPPPPARPASEHGTCKS